MTNLPEGHPRPNGFRQGFVIMLVRGDAGHPPYMHTANARRSRRVAGLIALLASLAGMSLPAYCKTPGAVHCYGQWCHRVSTLDEMNGMVGRAGFLKASYYDDCKADRFNTCSLTSSGEIFRPNNPDNAASPIFPDGTVILVYYPVTKKAAVLRVNSAGPYHGERRLDVSRATADRLGFREKGLAELMVTVVRAPEPHEAEYRRHRRYERVPGYMGVFSSFDAAHEAALANLDMRFGIVVSALDEGETTPLPPPDEDKDTIANMVAIELAPVLPRTLQPTGVTDLVTTIEAHETVAESSAAQLRAAPGATSLVAGSQVTEPAGEAVTRAVATLASREVREEEQPGMYDVAALDMGGKVSLRPSPDATIVAREKRAMIEIELAARTSQGFSNFIEMARRKARAGLPARARQEQETVTLSWRERLERFIEDARRKAREGVTGSGPLTRLTAELRIKAQPPRLARD